MSNTTFHSQPAQGKILAHAEAALRAYHAFVRESLDVCSHLLSVFKKSRLQHFHDRKKEQSLRDAEDLLEKFGESELYKFDPFRLAGFVVDEVSFSRVVASLLDPNERHGLRTSLLEYLLERIRSRDPRGAVRHVLNLIRTKRPVITVATEQWKGTTIPDIEIKSSEFLIFVENKLLHGQETVRKGEPQTPRQWEVLQEEANARGLDENAIIGLYLTPDMKSPSEKNFISVSYGDVATALRQAISSRRPRLLCHTAIEAFVNYFECEGVSQ